MQSQQPYQNPYEFITNPQKPKWTPVPGLTNASKSMRIVIFCGFLVVLIILASVVYGLISNAGKGPNLTAIAQDQNEIARIATLPLQTDSNAVQQQTTTNFAQTCAMSIASDQQQLISFLAANGTKLSTAQLGLTHNNIADTQLQTAVANNTLDQVFLTIMQQEFANYEVALKSTYASTQNSTIQKLLSAEYNHEQLLVKQLKAAQITLQNANN